MGKKKSIHRICSMLSMTQNIQKLTRQFAFVLYKFLFDFITYNLIIIFHKRKSCIYLTKYVPVPIIDILFVATKFIPQAHANNIGNGPKHGGHPG